MEFGLTELGIEEPLSAMRFRKDGRQMIVMPVNVEHLKPTPTNAPVTPVASTASTTPASEIKAPAAQPQPTTPTTIERKHPMPKGETATNGTALSKAIQQVEVTKEALKEVVHGLNDVLDTLKLAQKEQKNVDREIDSVRSTIKSLQKVSL
jgi:histone deacetylase complex regulatory component SIN3